MICCKNSAINYDLKQIYYNIAGSEALVAEGTSRLVCDAV
jgi:hypothetical protein